MKRVLKWSVPVDDKPHQIGSGKVVMVACQYGPESAQVWTEESGVGYDRQAQVYGTGHHIPGDWSHLGSAVAADGRLVWHLYAEPEPF